MNKLADVDTRALQAALADASSPKATKRLMIALAYVDGVPVDALSDRYDIPRATIYSWLDRFEHGSIPEAVADEPRPGRPPKLDDAHRERLARDIAASPSWNGYDVAEWTPDLVRQHIAQTFGVTYSLGHARRLLRELRPAR